MRSKKQDDDERQTTTTAEATVFARHFLLQQTIAPDPHTPVWLAIDDRTQETVAVKFFPSELIQTPGDFLTVRNVIAPVRQLVDPRVVAAREVATDSGFFAVITPWIDGASLAARRAGRANACFEPGDIEPWIRTLVDLMEKTHAAGVVHGALTPRVIFPGDNTRMRVTGFGVNAWLRYAVRTILHAAKKDQHSDYASPAVKEGAAPGVVDDVYSFGAIVYELIAGAAPHAASRWRRKRRPAPMEKRRREHRRHGKPIPPLWEKLVQACLDADPSRRLRDFRAVRSQFGAALNAVQPVELSTVELTAEDTLPAPTESELPQIGVAPLPRADVGPPAVDASSLEATSASPIQADPDEAPAAGLEPEAGKPIPASAPVPAAPPEESAVGSKAPPPPPEPSFPPASASRVEDSNTDSAGAIDAVETDPAKPDNETQPDAPPVTPVEPIEPASEPQEAVAAEFASETPSSETESAVADGDPADDASETDDSKSDVAAREETPPLPEELAPPGASEAARSPPADWPAPPAFAKSVAEKVHETSPLPTAREEHAAVDTARPREDSPLPAEPATEDEVEWRSPKPPPSEPGRAAAAAGSQADTPVEQPRADREHEPAPRAAADHVPAAAADDSYTVLPRRSPVRHTPTESEEPRVLFPRGRYADHERSSLGTFLLRLLLACTVLATIAVGGWWGWSVYQTRQEFAELWRDVQLFPPNASAASWERLEARLTEAQTRLSSDQWEALSEAWEAQKEALKNRRRPPAQ